MLQRASAAVVKWLLILTSFLVLFLTAVVDKLGHWGMTIVGLGVLILMLAVYYHEDKSRTQNNENDK